MVNRIAWIVGLVVLCVITGSVSGANPTVRIMPLGDSLTFGFTIPTYLTGYRSRLYSLLRTADYNVDFVGTQVDPQDPSLPDLDHQGHPGYRIDQIDAEIDGWLAAVSVPDVILLLIGTNDFYQDYNTGGAPGRLENLLARIASLRPSARIIVASLPLRTDIASKEAGQIAYNATIPGIVKGQVALGRKVHFLDMHRALNASDLSSDGVHPNQTGFNKMADAWFSAIAKVISPLGQSRGTARDLNGDGTADLLLQNAAGQILAWYVNRNGVVSSSSWISSASLGDWRIAGAPDLNGDGNADIIFQNTLGQIFVWYMNGRGAASAGVWLYPGTLGDWKIAGVADLNGDGTTDLLLQNAAGQILAWYVNGNGIVSSSSWVSSVSLGDWRIAGAADLNSDGNADIVFQNTLGQVYVWYLNGKGAPSTGKWIYWEGLGDWKVSAIADLNGDQNADILFQNGAGQIFVWHMNGMGSSSTGAWVYPGGIDSWYLR